MIKKDKLQKEFITGSEWLYYKLYCGEKTADIILFTIVKPFTEELLKEKLINKWFFIRYSDPESHLRIRFHLDNIKHIGNVILKFNEYLSSLMNDYLIWKVQTDTYKRELNRYGKETIEDVESLFFSDSVAFIKTINAETTDMKRFLIALKTVDNWLINFKFNTIQKLDFVERMKNAYKAEFNANKITTKQLNTIYYNLLQDFLIFDFKIEEYIAPNNNCIENILNKSKNGKLGLPIHDLLSSIIHMTINRFFKSKQRHYEFVIYYFLSKLFRTEILKNV